MSNNYIRIAGSGQYYYILKKKVGIICKNTEEYMLFKNNILFIKKNHKL